MTLRTLWNSIKERAYGTPAPKTPRRPRQPKPATLDQIPSADLDAIRECLVAVRERLKQHDLALTNQNARIHELEQIERRRSEREKEMKTNA